MTAAVIAPSARTVRLLARPRWEQLSLLGLLVGSGILYFVSLSINGYANSFYTAAVQAGSVNWEAFFYGSSDAGNSITVDKPPASLWIMALSVRIFGLSSWSILAPEAIMGVVTVALVYVIVRRHFAPRAALLAGATMALTPVAALMFRFDNPDALLLMLTTLAVYFTLRGIESGRIRWVLWAGAMIGLGFLTKQLQAFLVLPALAVAYFWAAPVSRRKRLGHLFAALGAVVLAAGWWVAIVELVPASMRPYIGGSQNNSFLELTFGYNGFGRITGSETGSVTGGNGGGAGAWGATGLLRLFTSEFAGQIAWLLPASLIFLVALIVMFRRMPRTSPRRATVVLLGGWLLITAIAFSLMAGIFHAYYTVALAAPLAGLVGIGGAALWQARRIIWVRIVLAVVVAGSGAWAFSLLVLSPDWLPWLRWVVLAAAVAAALAILARPWRGAVAAGVAALAIASGLAAPLAYSIETASTSNTGSIVTAGPSVGSNGFGGMGGRGGGPGGGAGGGFGGRQGGGQPPTGGPAQQGGQAGGQATTGGAPAGIQANATGGRGGGFLGGGTASSQVSALLEADAGSYRWVAATTGSASAATYQLATGNAVMPIGGFNGSDPSPTLEQFKQYVADGDIHYYLGGSVGASNGGSNESSRIASWVKANFTATTVDGATLYDLSGGTDSALS